MSNRRLVLFFLVGIGFLVGLVFLFEKRAKDGSSAEARQFLCTLPVGEIDAFDVFREGKPLVSLARKPDGAWELVRPFGTSAESGSVLRLLDAVALTPLNDRRSEAEIAALGAQMSDFGLQAPRVSVLLKARDRQERISFGAFSASGREIYACADDAATVFMVDAGLLSAVPEDADALRQRTVLPFGRDEIAELDFRVPDAPFVKLVRQASGWRLVAPGEAPAETPTVAALLESLLEARIAGFVLPSAEKPRPGASGVLSKDTLAIYGLAAGAGLSVTVRADSGASEQIVFGGAAGTNLVYALVGNGTAVVTMDAALAERCRVGDATFRDTRVFPLVKAADLKAVSITEGDLVYVLMQGSNGVWRLESPVVAPADPVRAVAIVDKVLRLKQNDLADGTSGTSRQTCVHVSVSTGTEVLSGVSVPRAYFAAAAAFADLRSKTVLELDAGAVKRLTLRPAKGRETIVVRDAEKGAWRLEGAAGATVGRPVSDAAVKKLLATLARVDATGVETVSATPADLARCGLVEPSFALAIDVDSAGAVRRNLLLGGAASGGGRYATVGGVDAIFVVSRQTVAALTDSVLE
ncbi:MAG: DUF4340 domain-containing protein [Kiritimatiellia bacterium]